MNIKHIAAKTLVSRMPLLLPEALGRFFIQHDQNHWIYQGPLKQITKGANSEMLNDTSKDILNQLHIFKALAENTHAIISAKDLNGYYLFVNTEYCRLFHLDKSAFIGHRDIDIFPAETAQKFRETDLLAQQSEDGITVESRVPIDGSIREFLTSKFPIRNEYGQVYATGLVATDINDMKVMQSQLIRYAETDSMTGCYNRRKLFDIAESELDRARRYQYPMSVLMCDLDHFKNINDTYGHAVGDMVIKRFAAICQKVLRKQDALGRVGGEEFSIILPHTDADEAIQLAARIQQELASSQGVKADEQDIAVTVSIGITQLSADTSNFDELLHESDKAMYEAKHAGRNCIKVYLGSQANTKVG